MYYTYIIRVEGGALYTGIAKSLFSRMKEHASAAATAAKYTRSHKILSLEAVWSSRDRSSASRLEYAIKTLNKKEKEAILASPKMLFFYLPRLDREDYVHHPKASLPLYLGKIDLTHLP